MPARNPYYDTPEFKAAWVSRETLDSIGARIGVSAVAVWRAGMRRGFPMKTKDGIDAAFLAEFNERVAAANDRPEGADHDAICAQIAAEYGMEYRRAADLVRGEVLGTAGTG